MAETKRYYWLKLKEDFFDDDVINWIEEQKNGKEYCLFYLKLCLKSLKNNGILIRNVGTMLVPYDTKKLAEITNTPEDTVIVAMSIFKKVGLVEVMENGALYLSQLQDMVGSESKWASKKRGQRLSKGQSGDNVPKLSERVRVRDRVRDKEVDIDKEVEVDSKKNNDSEFSECVNFWQENMMRDMTPFEFQTMQSLIEDYSLEWLKEAMKKAALLEPSKRNMKYITGILKGWKQDGGLRPWELQHKHVDVLSPGASEGRWIM